jgi:hypothetical protein
MRKLVLGMAAAALISIAGYVVAQTDRGTALRLAAMDTSPAAFRKLDTDNDGRISALEAAENPKIAAAFTMADKDKDGYLSREEFEAMSSASFRSDVDASSPSGDRVSDPTGDQPATSPNE